MRFPSRSCGAAQTQTAARRSVRASRSRLQDYGGFFSMRGVLNDRHGRARAAITAVAPCRTVHYSELIDPMRKWYLDGNDAERN